MVILDFPGGNSMITVFRRGRRHREEERKCVKMEVEIMLTSQRMCGATNNCKGQGKSLFESFHRPHGPANTLFLDFWLPGL